MLRILGLSLLLTTANAAGTEAPQLQSVTLDQLRSAPRQFAGRTVRLRGQVDQCWNMRCSLCPLDATPLKLQSDRCLAIDFDRMRGGEGNRGADMDAAFRYADVVVTARFDPTCLVGACLDRASVLLDARVEQVTRRRRSRDGLIWRPDRLMPAPASAAHEVAELVREPGGRPALSTSVFATSSDANASRSAVVCVWLGPTGTAASWPTSWQGALVSRSTEDSYRCWPALREKGKWRLLPN
jgi:hypothetical protein